MLFIGVCLFIVWKSIVICVDGVGAFELGSYVRTKSCEWADWLMEQYFPASRFLEKYGYQEAMSYESAVPEYFYDDSAGEAELPALIETADAWPPGQEEKIPEPFDFTALNGTTYTMKQLSKKNFIMNSFYNIDPSTGVLEQELSAKKLLGKDLSVDLTGTDYKILIYHTHGSEAFADSRAGEISDTIIGVGDYLTSCLTELYHIPVYHDRTVYDVVNGELDRSYAYTQAKKGVEQILSEHQSIEVVIDLHRDGVPETTRLVTEINGKETAQIMFLNGMSRSKKNGDIARLANPYLSDNLAFSFQLYLKGLAIDKDYMRRIYLRTYRYNLHLMPRTLLVEAGAQTNTLDEEKNAMEPLAAMLFQVLAGK